VESLLLRGQAPITEDAFTASIGDLLEDLSDPKLIASLLSLLRPVGQTGGAARGTSSRLL